MNSPVYTDAAKRHDFVLLFDVNDGNPNGDPDAGNLPRVDPETMQGLVTDVCLKRKLRDFALQLKGDTGRYRIYVQSGTALNTRHEEAYTAQGMKSTGTKQTATDITKARSWMCDSFFDIRMFGAVMTTGVNCGQVRGPLQLTFARSIDPIVPLDVSITRIAVTRPEDMLVALAEGDSEAKSGKQSEMGRKALVPYGLYRAHGFFNPHFAAQTGATADDLALVWQALPMLWDLDRSAARGLMACRGLYVFSHESALGNAPAHKLFEQVRVQRKPGVDAPRSFADYSVTVDPAMPAGVTLTTLVD